MLEEAGYEVETFVNGMELVERVRRDLQENSNSSIGAILTDIEMPLMGGVEATAEIRKLEREHPTFKPLPIIAITARALIEEEETFKRGGIDWVVTKPLRPADLDAALANTLSNRSTPPSSLQTRPSEPVCVGTALRDLTSRLWEELNQSQADSSGDLGLDGIDIVDVFERSGDSPRRTKLMLNAFLDSYQDPLNKLHDLGDPNSVKEVTRAAHSLKGMLLEVGAKHTADVASSIEQSLKAGGISLETISCEAFTAETTRIANLIERVVRHFPNHTTP
jgi:CheY-like chemotaxis protein/HPt (histidine-containing phosphotransfer) domain-containing protein